MYLLIWLGWGKINKKLENVEHAEQNFFFFNIHDKGTELCLHESTSLNCEKLVYVVSKIVTETDQFTLSDLNIWKTQNGWKILLIPRPAAIPCSCTIQNIEATEVVHLFKVISV